MKWFASLLKYLPADEIFIITQEAVYNSIVNDIPWCNDKADVDK